MKKKLIAAVGIITLIFIMSGIFIFANLRLLASQERLRDGQDRVLDSYSDIMVWLRSAQAELYRHEAGYSRDIDALAENILRIEDALSGIKAGYRSLDTASCNDCHAAAPKIASLQLRLDHASEHLRKYEEKVSLIATARDASLADSWENEASREGNKLLGIITRASEATARMDRHLGKLQMDWLGRSGFSIFAAIVLSALLSLAAIIYLMRSIKRRLDMLVQGIERVSSGNYDSKVDAVSNDEIGFLAETFNTMTSNLDKTTRQRDILEGELRELNASLEKRVSYATEELKRTHEQMLRTETLSAVGTLASGVAHELATPLASVINYVQMIRRRTDERERLAEEMSIVEKELVRCSGILRGMLSFVRAPETEKVPTDVNNIIRDLTELMRYRAKSGKVTVKESLEPSLPPVMAVPGQIKQVFMNIMVNAIEAMKEGGKLELETSMKHEGRQIAVRISDTGCGIPRSDLNRIFEPFYTSKNEGTGLGLSLTYGIVKGHGGDIEVNSEEGRGTTFVISLPVSQCGIAEPGGENGTKDKDMTAKSAKDRE
jgi:two-component system NtrC family sensor kinase